jgi:hypothetical protein
MKAMELCGDLASVTGQQRNTRSEETEPIPFLPGHNHRSPLKPKQTDTAILQSIYRQSNTFKIVFQPIPELLRPFRSPVTKTVRYLT